MQLTTPNLSKRDDRGISAFRKRITGTTGAIDLASIMVGVLVIGVVGSVIAASVFAVIPWSQDEAAKQSLGAASTAESVAKVKEGAYLSGAGLVSEKLLPASPALAIDTDETGTCFIAAATSATGNVFYSTSAGVGVVTQAEAEAHCPVGPAVMTDLVAPGTFTVAELTTPGRPLTAVLTGFTPGEEVDLVMKMEGEAHSWAHRFGGATADNDGTVYATYLNSEDVAGAEFQPGTGYSLAGFSTTTEWSSHALFTLTE